MATLAPADTNDTVCPVLWTARIVSGKWTLLMLRDLAGGPRRFGELERSLTGISPRTLTLRLRALEEEGVLERCELDGGAAQGYRLTATGRHLVPIVDAMREYGSRWLAGDERSARTLEVVPG